MKKNSPEKSASHIERFLKYLEREGQMLDDHGQTIIGRRDRAPGHEEPEKKVEEK